jgi:hypothetical protein
MVDLLGVDETAVAQDYADLGLQHGQAETGDAVEIIGPEVSESKFLVGSPFTKWDFRIIWRVFAFTLL